MATRQQLLEDGSGIRTVMDDNYTSLLEQKWEKLINKCRPQAPMGRYSRKVLAMLLENQSNHLLGLSEETRAVNVGSFTKFIFPLLLRVFPNLITPKLVSTQPMTGPVGAVFYMDYVYSTTKGPTTAGNVFPKDFDRDYTSEFVNGEILATGDGSKYGGVSTDYLNAVVGFKPVRPLNSTSGFSCVIKELNATTGATVQQATDDGNGGFTFSPTGANVLGQINYANGSIYSFRFQNVPASGNPIKVYYFYDGELNSQQATVSLDIKKKLLEAQPRRVKALWSPEAAEDLKALHGADAENELVGAVAREIGLEIDRSLINKLFQNSTTTTGTFDRIPPSGVSELEHIRSLLTVLSTVSSLIHKATGRAPANWIVTSPEISALLSQLTTHGDYRPIFVNMPNEGAPPGPMVMPQPLTRHGQFGVYEVGPLMNKWMLYEDPHFARDYILMGLQGDSYMDSGFVWAPYIPLQVTATFMDPNDMSFRKGMRTRYGEAMLRPEFYGQIRVLNM